MKFRCTIADKSTELNKPNKKYMIVKLKELIKIVIKKILIDAIYRDASESPWTKFG